MNLHPVTLPHKQWFNNYPQTKIAPGKLWNTIKKLQQPSGTPKKKNGHIRKGRKNFTWVTPSLSSATPLGPFLHGEKRCRRTPAAFTMRTPQRPHYSYGLYSLCHWESPKSSPMWTTATELLRAHTTWPLWNQYYHEITSLLQSLYECYCRCAPYIWCTQSWYPHMTLDAETNLPQQCSPLNQWNRH